MRVRPRASDQAVPWPNATVVDGRYRVEAALGKGGVAQVYRVADTSRAKRLALKRLSRAAPSRVLSLFELEYRTLASLRHPHTVEVYEFGRDESSAYYTMELLEGGDLRDAAPMPWRQVCAVLRDAALALGVLHARQLVHRDVSPRNLWRTLDDRIKLIDFGALAAFGLAEDLIGTPPLIPPEAQQTRMLDQRADLYALGGTGYYLLSGFHAYPARDLADLPDLWQRLETQFFRMWGGVYNALEQARTNLVLYSVFGALYILFGCLEVSLGAVRVARGSIPLTSAEIAFAALGSLGLLVAPAIIWTWFLAKHVWSSTPRVMDVLDRIRHVLGASMGTYAGLTLLIRILASTLHIDPSGTAWPGWGVLTFILAAGVGAAAARATLKARTLAD